MRFPLELRFSVISWGNTIRILDADGHLILFAKQQLLKLKERVTLFGDEAQTDPQYVLEADRVIDFNACYRLRKTDGTVIGTLARQGVRSLWRTAYTLTRADGTSYHIREYSVTLRMLNDLMSGIPILGLFAGYLFHPSYDLTRGQDGPVVLRLTKLPALWEGRFGLEEGDVRPGERELGLLAFTMMTLLERTRG